jgi:hypothetical protein
MRLDVKIATPASDTQVSDLVETTITVNPSEAVNLVQVYIYQGNKQLKQIAAMNKEPFTFQWNSHQLNDGIYFLQAVAFNDSGGDFVSRRVPVRVVNQPPDMWFVNCVDGQFIRGVYSLVISLDITHIELKTAPSLTINTEPGPVSTDRQPPYRYLIPTSSYYEGETLVISALGEDYNGQQKRIICMPRVDNTPPTIRFIRPTGEDRLLGRKFQVEFDAYDLFGIKEVRLWIDGSSCSEISRENNEDVCKKDAEWISVQAPNYPMEVSLTDAYKSEQTISLTARAVDNAGNISEPPARLSIRIDPLAPEIFIRSPGQGEVIDYSVDFIVRITDNDQLSKVEFLLESQNKSKALIPQRSGNLGNEITITHSEPDAVLNFGYGAYTFIVRATDRSGNTTESRRPFRVGCGDSADCAVGQVCHRNICMIPSGLNQPCDQDRPCAIGTVCTEGDAPVCSGNRNLFCRQRCHPGNKFVPPESCGHGFYCERDQQVCMPADGCTPLTDDCGTGMQCILVDNDAGICIPAGNVPNGNACSEACNPEGNCAKGSWCVFVLNIGRTACMTVCEVDNPSTCNSNERCYSLRWSFGGGSLKIGVCATP